MTVRGIKRLWAAENEGANGASGEAAVVDPAAVAAAVPAEGGDPQSTAAKPEADAAAVDAPAKKPWELVRIDQLTRRAKTAEEQREVLATEKAAAEAERDRMAAELADIRAGKDPTALPENEIQKRAEALATKRAQEIASEQSAIAEFNRRCNEVNAQGKKDHPDFQTVVQEGFNKLGGLTIPIAQAVLETEAPADVLYHLGSNPNELAEVLQLADNPVKLALALDRTARELKAKKTAPLAVSNAPAPITPVNGNGSPARKSLADAKTMEEFIAIRNAELGITATVH